MLQLVLCIYSFREKKKRKHNSQHTLERVESILNSKFVNVSPRCGVGRWVGTGLD